MNDKELETCTKCMQNMVTCVENLIKIKDDDERLSDENLKQLFFIIEKYKERGA